MKISIVYANGLKFYQGKSENGQQMLYMTREGALKSFKNNCGCDKQKGKICDEHFFPKTRKTYLKKLYGE